MSACSFCILTLCHMLCFKTYRGTMYYCCTLWTGFYPPDLCLSTCKEFIVRYNIICCVSKHSYYYYLYCFCRLVFPLPTLVRARNSLDVRCMANHIKAGMLIEKKVYVVHIKTSISTMEKTGMLYILKLVCLLQKHGKKRICCIY